MEKQREWPKGEKRDCAKCGERIKRHFGQRWQMQIEEDGELRDVCCECFNMSRWGSDEP